MPIFSVIVDEGHPAQAPCMCRYTTPRSKPWKVMSPPSCATAGRTRVSSSSLIWVTISASGPSWKACSTAPATPSITGSPDW